MRHRHPRGFIIFLTNLLLIWLLGLANHVLGQFSLFGLAHISLHIYVGGLLVAYSALRLDQGQGQLAVFLTALAFDALEPVPFGTSLVLFGLVYATLVYSRSRLPRKGEVFSTVVALLANLFLFLALSIFLVGANPRPGEAWGRLFADLLVSQIVLLLIAPWFFALQDRALALTQPAAHPNHRFSA